MEQYTVQEKPLQLSNKFRELAAKNLIKEIREAVGTSGELKKTITIYLDSDYPISVVWSALDELGATSKWIIQKHGLIGPSPFILLS